MDQRVIDRYSRLSRGVIDRSAILDGLADIAGSTALALLPLLQNDHAHTAIVPPDDARLAIK